MSAADDVITSKYKTVSGKSFHIGRRTEAHIDFTVARLHTAYPHARLLIIQGCYNTGVAASAGTHDKDGCLDFEIDGLGWWDAQRFLRESGWGCWYRHTGEWASRSLWHIHAISLGCPGPLGQFVDGGRSEYGRVVTSSQIDDYHRHALGLKGQHASGEDTSWFPPNIDATVFDYGAWQEEADMPTPADVWHERIGEKALPKTNGVYAEVALATVYAKALELDEKVDRLTTLVESLISKGK